MKSIQAFWLVAVAVEDRLHYLRRRSVVHGDKHHFRKAFPFTGLTKICRASVATPECTK
jgi:hypothetical protein